MEPPLSRSRRPPAGRGACAEQPRGPFISAEAALGRAERRAQGLDPARARRAERPLCRATAPGCVRARSQVGGVRRGEGAALGERSSGLEIGEGAWDQREAPRKGGLSGGEGKPRLGRERKLGGRLGISGGLGFGGQSPAWECGDNPKVGRGQDWGWVSEVGRGHWEPRLREGTLTLERRRGHPDAIWGLQNWAS